METEPEFCGVGGGFVILVFNLFRNIKKTTVATITTATIPPITMDRVLNDLVEGDA